MYYSSEVMLNEFLVLWPTSYIARINYAVLIIVVFWLSKATLHDSQSQK